MFQILHPSQCSNSKLMFMAQTFVITAISQKPTNLHNFQDQGQQQHTHITTNRITITATSRGMSRVAKEAHPK